MLFKRFTAQNIVYENRRDYFSGLSSYSDLQKRIKELEPHTVENTKIFIKNFSNRVPGGKALSIGCDPYKEWSLYKAGIFSEIHVFDLDRKFVKAANIFWNANDINIRYHSENVLDAKEISFCEPISLLLFQMDYIFCDAQYRQIIRLAKNANARACFVMTPSIFDINPLKGGRATFAAHDIAHLFLYLINNLRHRLYNVGRKHEGYWSYKRSLEHFVKLFEFEGFELDRGHRIINKNGSFHFFCFKNGPTTTSIGSKASQ